MSTAKTASEKGMAETSKARYYHLLFEFLEPKCKMRSLAKSVKQNFQKRRHYYSIKLHPDIHQAFKLLSDQRAKTRTAEDPFSAGGCFFL